MVLVAVTQQVGGRWFGLSDAGGDTKPTLGVDQGGHEFYETDTFQKFIWNPVGLVWEAFIQP